MNASNAVRKATVAQAAKHLPEPKGGTRRERRAALAKVRQALTNRGTLDALNDKQVGRALHPTRGWKSVSTKRTAAQTIAGMTKQGYGMNTAEAAEALKEAA